MLVEIDIFFPDFFHPVRDLFFYCGQQKMKKKTEKSWFWNVDLPWKKTPPTPRKRFFSVQVKSRRSAIAGLLPPTYALHICVHPKHEIIHMLDVNCLDSSGCGGGGGGDGDNRWDIFHKIGGSPHKYFLMGGLRTEPAICCFSFLVSEVLSSFFLSCAGRQKRNEINTIEKERKRRWTMRKFMGRVLHAGGCMLEII